MSLIAKKNALETKLADVQAQLDIVKDAIARGETTVDSGSITDNILDFLKQKDGGVPAKDIVTHVSVLTGANETSVRTRLSVLVRKKRIVTDGAWQFNYRSV